MNSKEYAKNVLNTEAVDFNRIRRELYPNGNIRLLHASMGVCTEAGELLDAIKKYFFYGKPLDENNFVEEIGDIMWYINIALDELGLDIEAVQSANIAKLKKRYPDKFDYEKAINRDVDSEMAEHSRILNKFSVDSVDIGGSENGL